MAEKKIIKTTCKSCHGGCGVMVEVRDGVITHIEGNPDSTTRGTMCSKGLSSIQHIDNPYRILYPHKRERRERVKANGKGLAGMKPWTRLPQKSRKQLKNMAPGPWLPPRGPGEVITATLTVSPALWVLPMLFPRDTFATAPGSVFMGWSPATAGYIAIITGGEANIPKPRSCGLSN